MSVLQIQQVRLSFGGPPVLDNATLSLERGERVCLVGRNGAGKSTLLRIAAGTITPEDGVVTRPVGSQLAVLEQAVPEAVEASVRDMVTEGLGEVGRALVAYEEAATAAGMGDEGALEHMGRLQEIIDRDDGWSGRARVDAMLHALGVDGEISFATLSGGMKRRVMLARALAAQPALLILDEPTNHLDIDSIAWMEEYLLRFEGALLFVTHDRTFVDRMATRIVELDRGKLTSWPGSYSAYLDGKEKALADEEKAAALFDKRLAQEEVWIRQGIKARRTRNEGRVRALEAMRRERAQRRERMGDAKMQAQEAESTGRLVIEAKGIHFGWEDGRQLVKDFSTRIFRGDKIGILGPNGAGKTTLLRLLLGQLAPQAGVVRLGTNLQIAYFDQLRSAIDGNRTVAENVLEKGDFVTVGTGRRHIVGYLQDFLFSPDRARSPAWVLSGGERNRLLLAKLFTQPANVLVMDEPTNDLDLETLELIESLVVEFSGTVLVVSHDRAFLDAVCTSTIAMDADGLFREYVGGYSDWVRQRVTAASLAAPVVARTSAPAAPAAVAAAPVVTAAPVAGDRPAPRKRSWKEKQELEQLPLRIEALEAEQKQLHALLEDPELYRKGAAHVQAQHTRLAEVDAELERGYARWLELEAE